MPASRTAALGLTLLLAAGLAACGGDDDGNGGGGSSETVSAEAYAADVCGAMKDWVSTIQDQAASIGENIQARDAQSGKDALSDLLADMSASTGDLVSAVEDAGVPNVDGGEEAADSLVSAFEDLQAILDDAQQDVADLPTDPEGFKKGAAELAPTLQEALSSVGSSLEEPESQELQEAFENEESCSAIA